MITSATTADDNMPQLSAQPLLPPLHYDKAAAVGALLGISSAELEQRLQQLLHHRSELKHRRRQQGRRARKAARHALAAARSEAAAVLRHQVHCVHTTASTEGLLHCCRVGRLCSCSSSLYTSRVDSISSAACQVRYCSASLRKLTYSLSSSVL
jgi:hypothetical protein